MRLTLRADRFEALFANPVAIRDEGIVEFTCGNDEETIISVKVTNVANQMGLSASVAREHPQYYEFDKGMSFAISFAKIADFVKKAKKAVKPESYTLDFGNTLTISANGVNYTIPFLADKEELRSRIPDHTKFQWLATFPVDIARLRLMAETVTELSGDETIGAVNLWTREIELNIEAKGLTDAASMRLTFPLKPGEVIPDTRVTLSTELLVAACKALPEGEADLMIGGPNQPVALVSRVEGMRASVIVAPRISD